MYYSKVWLEPFALYTETTKKLVSDLSVKIITSTVNKTQLTNEYTQYRPTSRGENEQGSSSANQLFLTYTNSLVEFLFKLGRHDISCTRMSLVFK